MTSAPKRPYVKPRVGHSTLRSLWYLFAFLGVLAVAFMIPRNPAPPPDLSGNWTLESQADVGLLPAGHVEMLIQDDRYALQFEGTADGLRSGFESGSVEVEASALILVPRKGAYLQADGAWSRQLPPSRRFNLGVMEDGRIVLTDSDGDTLIGGR